MSIVVKQMKVIECDIQGCKSTIECTPAVVGSGWTKKGEGSLVWYFCPDHSDYSE